VMWINFFILVVLMSSAAYAGDYGRESSSADSYASKADLELKVMQDYVKGLPKEAKSVALKNYLANKSARSEREMNSPGSSMQEYVELAKRLGPKLSNIANSDKGFLLSNYHYALLFTGKSQAEADEIFIKTMHDTAMADDKQRNLALRDALL
jgi:hypothetical protein